MSIKQFYQKKIYPNIYYLYHTANAVRYRKFALRCAANPSFFSNSNLKKVMRISKGEFTYTAFNFCYLHNVLSLTVYAMYHGCYPQICINKDNPDNIQWEWYFEPICIRKAPETAVPTKECPIKAASFQPHFQDIYRPELLRMWAGWYEACVHLNNATRKYIDTEYDNLFSNHRRVLGVICRGTDYVTLHPPGHPVQPDVKDVISLCKQHMKDSSYDAIYLATEERQIRDLFQKAFPGMILENKRHYYDDIYYKDSSIQYIKDVHFARDNNNYWSGLEYLSSITLLSRCTSLIGGNCGGTIAAVFLNNGKYEFSNVFDLGLYP